MFLRETSKVLSVRYKYLQNDIKKLVPEDPDEYNCEIHKKIHEIKHLYTYLYSSVNSLCKIFGVTFVCTFVDIIIRLQVVFYMCIRFEFNSGMEVIIESMAMALMIMVCMNISMYNNVL